MMFGKVSNDTAASPFRKMLLNRLTATPQFTEFLQLELAKDDELYKHTFHKIMIHNWGDEESDLMLALAKRCATDFVPVHFTTDEYISFFYTDSLSFIQKMMQCDFIFPHNGNMYNIDILFGDKTSMELFSSRVSTEQVVSGVISRRFSNTLELDLSSICEDPELKEKRIHLYSISQLSLYKRLMLRMGRDTKILNLSNNNLSVVPQEVMNFFMRGEIIGVNLSDNTLTSLEKLPRMSSLLERLWLEGNPLCVTEEPASYIRKLTVLFPRLRELDGVVVNRHGIVYPLIRNYLTNTDARCITDKLLTLYFTHYDNTPRSSMFAFYHPNATLTITNSLSDKELIDMPHWAGVSRNLLSVGGRMLYPVHINQQAPALFRTLPETTHDPTTFTVDVISYSPSELTVCVDGVFRERRPEPAEDGLDYNVLHFRRTLHMKALKGPPSSGKCYTIHNEMLHVAPLTSLMREVAFKNPVRKLNELSLSEPMFEHARQLTLVFAHITGLKHEEAERRLKLQCWDIRKSLLVFSDEVQNDRLSLHYFADPSLDNLTDEEVD